jgi:hypothetical protein
VQRAYHLKLISEVIHFSPPINTNNFLKVVSINAQSIANLDHINILRHLLSNKIVDIVAVSETWLKSKNSDKFCSVNGYNIARNDREGKGGGGVALFVKHPLQFKVVASSPNLFDPTQVEFIFCEITLHNTQILVAALYKRPYTDCNFDKFIHKLHQLKLKYDSIIMLGDFNVNFSDNTNKTKRLVSTFEDLDLTRLPINYTHDTKTSIDAIFTTSDISHNSFGKLPNLLSAHDMLYAVFDAPHDNKAEDDLFHIREFDSISRENLLDRALVFDWSASSAEVNLDDQVSIFSKRILDFYDENLPLKALKPKNSFRPRLPQPIKLAIKHRDALCKLASKINLFSSFPALYRAARNRVKQLIATFHRSVIHNKLCNLIGKNQIWKTLRNLGLVKSKTNTQALPDDLDALVKGLTMSPDIDESKINYDYNLDCMTQGDQFYFSHVEPVIVKNAIFDIDSSAEGSDKICIRMIRSIWQILVIPITNIIDTSLQISIFPSSWKRAILSPIPKIRNPVTFKDFRPISLLCTLSKVLEKVANNQIVDYINARNIMDPFQSGYRKLHSTATALLKISEEMRNAIFKKRVVITVYLDYTKAFDCVDHKLLIHKLRQLNFSEPVLSWISSYLSDRHGAVRGKKGAQSEWIKITRGVPQGSVLAPLLFCLYTHDICKILRNRCKYHIYADDTQLYIECAPAELNEAIRTMNIILGDIVTWSEQHGLKLNPTKTQALLIASPATRKHINTQNLIPLTLLGSQIPFTDTVKNLGVYFDTTLSWDKHISSICQKVYGALNNLHKFRDVTPEIIRLRLVKSLILPHFDYCSFVYCNINCKQRKRLQNALNAAIKYVYNVPFAASLSPYFVKAQILKVQERHDLEILLMTHKIVHKTCPDYLSDLVTLSVNVSTRQTRAHKFKINVPRVGRLVPENSFVVKCSRLWNKLPENVCSTKNIDHFKSEIFSMFLRSYEVA